MTFCAPVTLVGDLVTLEPLARTHHDGIVEAVTDGEVYRRWYTTVPTPEGVAAEIERRLQVQERGLMVPFVARRTSDGAVLGMTSFMNIDAANRRLEIGSTFNRASAWGTGTNVDSKLLLLTHAFDELDCVAVEFRTHWHNQQSRQAIERLGAKRDGVLRNHMVLPDGSLRDTVVYSILPHEWPAVRNGLRDRLDRHLQR